MSPKVPVLPLVGLAFAAFAGEAPPANAPNPFFAFKNSMETAGPASVDEQVKILKELGFDGFDNRNLNDLEAHVNALERAGMKLFTSYLTVKIDPGETPYNPVLPEALKLLEGHGTVLWCNTQSKQFEPSDPAGDALAVPIFQEIADLAAPYGVKVAPYPHIDLWVESPQDAVRLLPKVDRPNFGTSFNLFHWKALKERALPLEEVVRLCAPRLMVLSLNGPAGPAGIGPLEEEGLPEYARVLGAFRDAGYRGPVGLQCYRIPTDPREHLAQSMRVWRKLMDVLGKEEASKTP